jgi:hypothetical protein
MFKTSILMLAAVASVGATLVLSTSSADARPGFGGFRGGFHGGVHRLHFRPHFRPHFHRHVRWHRPWVYGVGAAAVAAPVYAAVAPKAPQPGPCTCLSKEYTQDNLVVFKDRCTKETAAAPIGGPQQQGQAQPEAGEAEPMPTK